MALHPDFPSSPYEPLLPEQRCSQWRGAGYAGALATTRALLNRCFHTDHITEQMDGSSASFHDYFAQREAVESLLWLYDPEGREELDVSQKMARLRPWCDDASAASRAEGRPALRFV